MSAGSTAAAEVGLLALLGLPAPQEWQKRAACLGVDPKLFFPKRGDSTADAKAVCRGCPVRQICLDTAMAAGEGEGERFGIWGGLSERERRRIRARRRKVNLQKENGNNG